MKKMTCKAMGGSCETEIHGATAEELMEKGKQHVHDLADGGDEGHKAIVQKMTELSEEGRKQWSEDFKKNFDTLEDA